MVVPNSTLNMKSTIKFLLFTVIVFTFTSYAFSQVPNYVPTNGLVGYWPFNGNANDESGNGNNGTVNGATLTSDRFGNVNSAYDFNGTSDFIDVADNTALRLNSTDFTISVWINETSRASTQESIISKRTAANGNGYILNIEGSVQPIPGLTNFHVSGGGDPRAYSNTIVPLNVWKNITLTYQLSSQTLKTYIDGVLNSTTTSIPTPNAANSVAMKIGTDAAGNPYFFHGKIDDISIYNRALTQQEITNLYTSTIPVSCLPAYVPTSGLVGYWPFCGNANDESGNGNNGTVNGATLTSDRFGNVNSAYDFNGTSDFIDVADNTALRLNSTDFTISVWINETSRASTQESIISKRTAANGNGYILNIEGSVQPIPGLTNFHVSGGGDPRAYSNTIVPLNVWKNITLTYQLSSQTLKTYIDGVLNSTTTSIPTPNAANSVAMKIGTDAAGNPYFFHGKIDDISIYNRALTQQEITNLYTSTVPVSCLPAYVPTSGLVGYWPFCGNANDESGNGNNGTVNGATLTTDRNGVVDKAYSFDGSSWIDILSNGAASGNNKITLSAWVYRNSLPNSVEYIFCYGSTGNEGIAFGMGEYGSQGIFTTFMGSQFDAISNIPLSINSWHNITSIHHQNGIIEIYLDGNLTFTTNVQTPNIQNILGRIGKSIYGNEFWNGKIDDIGIWNRALTQQEITNLYTSTVPPSVAVLSGDATICAGASTNLSVAVTGGTAPYTVTVTDGTNNYSATGASPVSIPVSPTATSSYTIVSVTGGGTGTGNTGTAIVTVIDATISASDSVICAGENILLNVPSYSVGDSIISPAIYLANITQGSVFEYSSTVPPAGWQTSSGGWPQGALPFSGVNTGSVPNSTYWPLGSTYYLRKQIDLSNYNLSSINWSIGVDNGYSLYLNGVLISSDNQGGPATEWEYIGDFPQNLLNLGTNYIALIISDDGAGGASFNMKVTGNKSATHAWSPGGATTSTINVTPTSTTTYTCTTTTNGVSCTDSVTVVVNNPTIDLGNDVTACGTSTTLTAPTGFDSYLWSNGGTTNTTTVSANGTYSCMVTQGLCSASDSIDVTLIDATITASDSVICPGDSVTLSVSQGGSSNTACAALPTNLQTGLVGYWPFCGNANDESGNGNNGTVNGATLTTDRFGNTNSAYSFDGNDDINVGNSSAFNITTDHSISYWYNQNTIDMGAIFSKNNGGGNQNKYLMGTNQYGTSGDFLHWNSTETLGQWRYSGIPVGNSWNFILWRFTSNNIELYRNGVLFQTYTYDVPIPMNIIADLIFGSSEGSFYFQGKIDDVIFHNRALSSSEIQQLYTQGQTSYSWSNGSTAPTINVSPSTTTTYTCTITTNGVSCTDSVTVVVNNPTIDLGNDVTACGTSTTLTAPAGFDSYLWSNGATTNTTTVNVNGTYSCTVTQGGCSASDSIDITLIDATISASDSTICVGETTTLSVPQGGSSNTACAALPTNLQTGLVGYWPFCGNANDESGNGNNGTVNGATLTTDRFGSANSAYSFNGTTHEIVVTNSPSLNFETGNAFTISYWISVSNIYLGSENISFVVIKQNGAGTQQDGYNLGVESVFASSCRIQNGPSTPFFTFGSPINSTPLQTWLFVCQVYDGSHGKTYHNNILVGDELGSALPGNNSADLRFGKPEVVSTTGRGLNGKIDDISMFNRALTPSEIQQLYTLGQTTYLWSNGATTPTINVSPTTTTTYTCTTTTNGVSCTDSITVVVNNPTIDLGNDVTVCGTSTTLTAPTGFDSYLWSNGGTTNTTTVSANGTYTCMVTQSGCIATDSIDVVLVPLTTNTTPISACNSYVWNGTTYTASGVYTGTTSNCVTQSLNLTITPSATNTTTISSCGPYTWVNNGQTYTQSGVYTGTSANCVTQSLNLTITPATTTGSVTTSICTGGSYIWPANGQTYTTAQSGITVVTGCNTATLNLTITPNSINTTTASACTSLTWNGTTYTASGVYTGATANCVTQSLNLTINPSSTNTTTISSCGTYTWGNNGQTYTSSGVYSGTTANCVTQSLNLTIIPNTSVTTTINAIDTYTWVANGLTYTTSGIYTGPTSANCVTQYLNLTINSSGISEEEMELFSLYPNPVSEILYVNLNGQDKQDYLIIDNFGSVVKRGVLENMSTEISVSELSAGLYYFKIVGTKPRKFSKIN